MDRQTVIERKTRLDGTSEEFVCDVLELLPGKRAVLHLRLDHDWDVAGVLTVPAGTSTYAHYWIDRPYNVYHWVNAGRTLAYYVNIADEVTIQSDLVAYRDLVLDVLIRPSGALEVLDEDELPADLETGARRSIADAMEVVVTGAKMLMREVEEQTAGYSAYPRDPR